MNIKAPEDYKILCEEQSKALRIQANIIRERDKEIRRLNKKMASSRNIIRNKGLI